VGKLIHIGSALFFVAMPLVNALGWYLLLPLVAGAWVYSLRELLAGDAFPRLVRLVWARHVYALDRGILGRDRMEEVGNG